MGSATVTFLTYWRRLQSFAGQPASFCQGRDRPGKRGFIAEGSPGERAYVMALIPPRAIARVSSSSASELAAMSWEWVMRADGQVLYRLAEVDGRSERNRWRLVTQLAAVELQALRGDRSRATAVLGDLARQHGHKIG
jgi:hypothetical protein